MRHLLLWPQLAALLAGILLTAGTAVAAGNQLTLDEQRALASKYWLARPVYLNIRAIKDKQHILSRKQIAEMATKALDKFGASTILMNDDVLPDRVRVLRIMYVIREQPTDRGVVIAASANIDLLRTAPEQYSTVLATSIYSGLQQTLIQAGNSEKARQETRKAFERSLDKRIKQAFIDTAAQ
ncbi:MAG: hypothetical protein PF501_06630 [Salinisphaera sp.]|jgi:hypothetical protein|nr:hypothetical protein [Salinisphaera sp.]